MDLLARLEHTWQERPYPFLEHGDSELHFRDVAASTPGFLSDIRPGEVVALIGDFDPVSISCLLQLIQRRAIVVPLTSATEHDHEYFFEAALVDAIISPTGLRRRSHDNSHALIQALRELYHPGLVLFSSGTTARPKAILHDLTHFLRRYETPRPPLRTLNFLLFDHIGGLNTLLHTMFNGGTVVTIGERTVGAVIDACTLHRVEVLPATPTFLRMLLMSGMAESERFPRTLKCITYGTERMDQPTLDQLCSRLPGVDFRQTYGTSELGIVRVKSDARDSLFMKIGGEGVQTRVVDGVLHIRSESRMLGYLNAPSPFEADGWYDTRDLVEERNGSFRITGRAADVINVAGLKFMPAEVERVALQFPSVVFATAYARANPITGQHVELVVEPRSESAVDLVELKAFLAERLLPHMVPRRIRVEAINVGHRFKKGPL